MRWSELPLNPSPRMLRQFAGLWILFFGALAAWHGWVHGEDGVALALAAVALVIGLPGVLRPHMVRPVFLLWLALTFPIGWLVSRTVLVLLFAGIMTPVAIFFRMTGRDVLRLRRQPDATSYWAPKPAPRGVRSYFRQF